MLTLQSNVLSGVLVLVLLATSLVLADELEAVYNNCGDSITCAERELIQRIDKIDSNRYLKILGDMVGIERKQRPVAASKESPRGYEDVLDRVTRYLSEHELKLQFPTGALTEVRSSKLRRIILPLLLILKLKAAIIMPIVLSFIALIAFKGLAAGILALFISGGAAFKSALDHHRHDSKLTYEVVPPAISPPWSRSSSSSMEYYSTSAPVYGGGSGAAFAYHGGVV